MKKNFFLTVLGLLLSLLSCNGDSTNDFSETNPADIISAGTGKIDFNSYAPLKDKPITLHYTVPNGDKSTMSILFVLPGTNRDADNYIKPWIELSKKYHCMVFALEFPKKYYTSDEYITGNVIDQKGNWVEKEKWTFSILEPVFEYIKSQTGNHSKKIDLFGHSAGAQFVHRYLLFNPEAPVNKAVSANAGWYTLPDFNVAFPYGVKETQLTAADISAAFKANIIIHLGQKDNDPNDPDLRKTPEANAQGLHRYARGLYFYTKSKTLAENKKNTYNWTKREVPNVGHDQTQMAKDAAITLFEGK